MELPKSFDEHVELAFLSVFAICNDVVAGAVVDSVCPQFESGGFGGGVVAGVDYLGWYAVGSGAGAGSDETPVAGLAVGGDDGDAAEPDVDRG